MLSFLWPVIESNPSRRLHATAAFSSFFQLILAGKIKRKKYVSILSLPGVNEATRTEIVE
jgi:hypothetical protein